jgi:N-methylhydantoinase B
MISPLGEGDVLIGVQASGAGYGDPLRRDPQLVAKDVRDALVSEQLALSLYGVVLRDGQPDDPATDHAREAIRRTRLAEAQPAADAADGAPADGADAELLHRIADTVDAVELDGRRRLRCNVCGHDLGDHGENPKRAALMREVSLRAINPHNSDCLEDYVLREYYCPGCATSFAADIARLDEPLLDEVALAPPGDR